MICDFKRIGRIAGILLLAATQVVVHHFRCGTRPQFVFVVHPVLRHYPRVSD